MRKSRFTDSQILDAVKRVEAGIGVPDLCRDIGISTATFYKWRATDDGEVQSSNAGELLSSTEIEIGLKVFLGVLSSAKQFDRLLREQLLR